MFAWLVNQILGNIPLWIWPFMAGAGFGAYILVGILSHLPNFKPWEVILKPICALIFVAGVFMWGGAGVTSIYQAQILEMQHKIDLAVEQSNNANSQIKTKVVTKIKTIHDTKVVVQHEIKEVEKKIDSDCKFDPEATKILNDAAKNPVVKDSK